MAICVCLTKYELHCILGGVLLASVPVVELVSEVVGRDDVEQKNVFGLGVESRHAELQLRKHLPETKKKTFVFNVINK